MKTVPEGTRSCSTSLAIPRRNASRMIDEGNNGLVVNRLPDRLALELVHKEALVRSEVVFRSDNPAELDFAKMLLELLIAGVTAGIPSKLPAEVVSQFAKVVGKFNIAVDSPAVTPLRFSQDMAPSYEYLLEDTLMNGCVRGTVGVYAVIVEPDDEDAVRSRGPSRSPGDQGCATAGGQVDGDL